MAEIYDLGAAKGPRTAHEFARDVVRRAIRRGDLPGGTRLVQSEIAAQLDLSTTPVREALRDLATEGLVRIDPHRGAVVREVGIEQVQEVIDLRMLLEPEALRLAAGGMEPATLASAKSLQHELEHEEDFGRWAELLDEFEAVVASGSSLTRLTGILKTLRDAAAPAIARALRAGAIDRDAAVKETCELLAALERSDAERAADVTTRRLNHLNLGLEQAYEAGGLGSSAPPAA